MARWMQIPGAQRLMVWVIHLLVPRHLMGINLVVVNDQGQILLLKHVFHPYAPWGLPGGWLNRGEDPKECALRELREETGLTAVLDRVLVLQRSAELSQINAVYLAFAQAGTMQLSSEIMEARWFEPEALPEPLTTITRQAIVTAVTHHSP
ncbi:MAG: NUDIX domain-containing protein [Anaerolineae bacterium]|nr:NUDIX domain-containing protein [Anaerolineae bacterium]